MNARRNLLAVIAASVVGALASAGCGAGSPARVRVPEYDSQAAGKAAIEMYDTNHDGVISGAELDQCPALKRALHRYDTGGDGKITAANIAARIQSWKDARIGIVHLVVRVYLDGDPLGGAQVVLDPEPFLGDAGVRLIGATASYGAVSPIPDPSSSGTAAASKPGAAPGLYKVRISKIVDGQETIPARYNTKTELGVEVAPDSPDIRGLRFDLSSK